MSKLLLAINSGKGQNFKGKTLEDIEVSDNFESDSESESASNKHENDLHDAIMSTDCENLPDVGQQTSKLY